jgi:hypothetical protein
MTALVAALFTDWISPRLIGEAALSAVGAITLGFIVARIWPRGMSPQLFGILVAAGFLGVLAYFGFVGAMVAIVFLVVLAAVMALSGML